MTPTDPIKYSIIVLLEEQSPGFADYLLALRDIFAARQAPYEIIVVANETEPFLRQELAKLPDNTSIRALALNRRVPQAVCLQAGFEESGGDIIVACGSYQQITNRSFDALLDGLDPETDIVSPWRQNRVDPRINQAQSRLFNAIVRTLVGTSLNDLSCTVRVFRRQVLEETKLYGNMYRFLPIIAAAKGFRSKEVPCEHMQERGKTGLYGVSLYLERLIDILTLYFNTRFARKPLRFFGNIGALFLGAGSIIILIVFLQKAVLGTPIGGRAILLLAVLLMVLGVQAASVGLLGEIITFTQGRQRKEYSIDIIIGSSD